MILNLDCNWNSDYWIRLNDEGKTEIPQVDRTNVNRSVSHPWLLVIGPVLLSFVLIHIASVKFKQTHVRPGHLRSGPCLSILTVKDKVIINIHFKIRCRLSIATMRRRHHRLAIDQRAATQKVAAKLEPHDERPRALVLGVEKFINCEMYANVLQKSCKLKIWSS